MTNYPQSDQSTQDDFGSHPILGEYDPAEARALADAIYKELGLGWLPYPENKPEKDYIYIVTFRLKGTLFEEAAIYKNGTWSDMLGGIPNEDVVAYRNQQPYQPESEEK